MKKTITREYYVDNLRWALTILVVTHHAGQAYGPTGGAWPAQDIARAQWLGSFFSVNASFFMGLFFLLSGYVMPRTFERYGAGGFTVSKIARLLVPLAAVPLGIFFPINFVTGEHQSFAQYLAYLKTDNGAQSLIGHLWFIQHLFVYSTIYAGCELILGYIRPMSCKKKDTIISAPVLYSAAGATLILIACLSYRIREFSPVDSWIVVLGFIRVEPAHMPHYAFFFLWGIIMGKCEALHRIRKADGMIFLSAGIVSAIALIKCASIASSVGIENMRVFRIFIEAGIGITISVGLLVFFREFCSGTGRVCRFLSDNSYGVYLYHVFPVVGLQQALSGYRIYGSVKFLIVTTSALAMSYLTIFLVRKIRIVRRCV